MKIWEIKTHHRNREEAAEEWKRLGICAIGFVRLDDFQVKSKGELEKRTPENYTSRDIEQVWNFYNGINKGDLVLAYTKHNTIAYVGEVEGPYEFRQDNVVGDPNGFGYPRQRRVKWWDEPHHFSRWNLPKPFAKQFGKRGFTIRPIEPGAPGCEGFIRILKACAISGSKMPGLNEDMVKAGLIKHLYRSLNVLELGLKIKRVEPSIRKRKRPDFIAEDKEERPVLIECKGTASGDAVDQIKDYEKKYGKGASPRLMIVAFKIDEMCRSAAKSAGNVELFECDLSFRKIFDQTT